MDLRLPVNFLLGDVTDGQVMDEALSRAVRHSEGTVHLINNAGITRPEFPQSDSAWQSTIDINLTAPFRWSREFGERRVAEEFRDGSIVFIGSLATERGFPRNPSYQASKAGVLGLTRAFACDLGPFGIRVNCVSPGYIRTAMTDGSYRDPALNLERARHTVIGRWGESEDVAHAVAFLCDPASTYITGINLPVDGGWLAKGLITER